MIITVDIFVQFIGLQNLLKHRVTILRTLTHVILVSENKHEIFYKLSSMLLNCLLFGSYRTVVLQYRLSLLSFIVIYHHGLTLTNCEKGTSLYLRKQVVRPHIFAHQLYQQPN